MKVRSPLMARQIRLGKLSTGLAKELQDYLAAIRGAKCDIDRARAAVAKAFQGVPACLPETRNRSGPATTGGREWLVVPLPSGYTQGEDHREPAGARSSDANP